MEEFKEIVVHGLLCGLMCAFVHEIIDFIKAKIKGRKK